MPLGLVNTGEGPEWIYDWLLYIRDCSMVHEDIAPRTILNGTIGIFPTQFKNS